MKISRLKMVDMGNCESVIFLIRSFRRFRRNHSF